MHSVQHFPHGKRLQIRPEVFCAVPGDLAHDLNSGVVFFEVDADVWVVLIVPEQDIIVRLVFLDEVTL